MDDNRQKKQLLDFRYTWRWRPGRPLQRRL